MFKGSVTHDNLGNDKEVGLKGFRLNRKLNGQYVPGYEATTRRG